MTKGPLASGKGERQGAFVFEHAFKPLHRVMCVCIASSGDLKAGVPWEHVSVHAVDNGHERTPTWLEMCWVKDKFWEEECVVQFHPPHSQYINTHPHTLHLWRPLLAVIPMPPRQAV